MPSFFFENFYSPVGGGRISLPENITWEKNIPSNTPHNHAWTREFMEKYEPKFPMELFSCTTIPQKAIRTTFLNEYLISHAFLSPPPSPQSCTFYLLNQFIHII